MILIDIAFEHLHLVVALPAYCLLPLQTGAAVEITLGVYVH